MVSMHQASHVTSALDLPCCWWAYLTSPQLLEFYWFDVENRKLQLSLAQKKSRHIKTHSNAVTAAAHACFCGCSTFFFICWWTWRNSGQVFLLEDPLANQKCFPRSPVQKPRVAWESRRLVEQWAVWISRRPKHQPKTIASQRPSRLNKQKPHICASGAWFFSSIFQPFFWDQSWNCKHRSMVT